MEENIKDHDDTEIYEVGYHLLPTVQEADLPSEVAKIQSIISDKRGSIISESFPESRNLAYEIKKRVETGYTNFNKAFFGWIKFEAQREALSQIKESLSGNQNILRFILIKTVRENTMHTPRVAPIRRDETGGQKLVSETSEDLSKSGLISEEEIDKSIEALIEN